MTQSVVGFDFRRLFTNVFIDVFIDALIRRSFPIDCRFDCNSQ